MKTIAITAHPANPMPTEMPILRKAIVLTVYYALKANDDQGEESQVKSLTMRRELERTHYLPSLEEVTKAKTNAEELAKATLKFKHNGSRIPVIKNVTATVEFETY